MKQFLFSVSPLYKSIFIYYIEEKLIFFEKSVVFSLAGFRLKSINFRSLKATIAFLYSVVFFVLLIIVCLIYYFTSYYNFLDNHTRSSQQLTKIISNQLDDTIDQVNAYQVRILESPDILEYIFEQADEHSVTEEWQFRDDLYSIVGYNYEFYHMNIINLEDSTIHTFGESYYYMPYTITYDAMENIVIPTIELDGAKNIIPPSTPCLHAPREGVPVISVERAFGRYPLAAKTAVIEIQIEESTLEDMISDLLYTYDNANEQVIIFDKDLNPIYPSTLADSKIKYYSSLDTEHKTRFQSAFFDTGEIVTAQTSEETGFTTMVITSESYILKNRLTYLLICCLSFLGAFGILMFTTYRLARRISRPITILKDRMSRLNLEQIDTETDSAPMPSSFSELDVLDKAYTNMQHRLKKSLDDAVNSRTLTIHSQMMALQAQMDSHFLYNTLTIISIFAEDNDDEQVASMCIKLTQMLRYITEDISKDTTFSLELAHTRNYTDLISIRFGKDISFDYQIDTALGRIRLPRLIIQPIVENCVKYSRKPDRILKISIRAWIENGFWCINIQDNGDGFSKETLDEIDEKIRHFNLDTENPVLSINGMGLVNIYLRLKLYYNDKFYFKLENKTGNPAEPGGVSITIGGKLQ